MNAEKARIYGLSLNVHSEITSQLQLDGGLNLTRGRVIEDQSENRPLAHIPPLYGNVNLQYNISALSLTGAWRFNGSKDLSEFGGSADNPEFATTDGALAWNTLNLYANYAFTPFLQLSLGLENITDRHYRQFASGVSASGRNAIISLKGSF